MPNRLHKHGVYQGCSRRMTEDNMSLLVVLGGDVETRRFISSDRYIRKFGGSKLMSWGPLCSF